MNLWDPKTIRQIMAMFGLGFRKEFGQNFLTDPMVIEDIADACSLTEDCSVLEIGPGIGVLTQALAERYQIVKALEIDGAAATAENVRSGTYPVSRTLCIVMPRKLSSAVDDFLAFIGSEQGRAVVEAAGYVSCGNGKTAPAADVSGRVTVTGSSSVFPVMEKLAEAYMAVRPEVSVVVQISDSTTGIRDAANGLCDLGMTSRPLTAEEADAVQAIPVALDGIAVIVHPKNPVNELKSWQVYSIYTGSVTKWEEIYG